MRRSGGIRAPYSRACASIHEYEGIYHIYDDGRMMQTLGDYVSPVLSRCGNLTPPPVGDVDLAQAKKLYGDRTCLKGCWMDLLYVIKMGTPTPLSRPCEAIEIAAPGGGFTGIQRLHPRGTPVENVRAYFTAAHRYGVYPTR